VLDVVERDYEELRAFSDITSYLFIVAGTPLFQTRPSIINFRVVLDRIRPSVKAWT